MSEGVEKLKQDVVVLATMAGEMTEYLSSDVLFWRMMYGGMPMLTLGGYLMRQHRLLALPDLLAEGEWERVRTAVAQFNSALTDKVVRFETKAHTELEARLRQWGESLKERGDAGYGTAVETRLMIKLLVDMLQSEPYQLNPRIPSQVHLLDSNLRNHWQPGDFVWPDEWQPAYPKADYWWLYGRRK
jgi:hypothetical protein